MEKNKERELLAALSSLPGLGSQHLNRLLEIFGSAQALWQTDFAAINAQAALPEKVRQKWNRWRQHYDFARAAEKRAAAGVRMIALGEDEYPALLAQTYNPPPVLFYQGKLPDSLHLLALVGSRKATPYGKNAAHFLARELSENGGVVVSGGARGIDTQAHLGALEGPTPTVAVVASGLDITYPKENKKLFQRIVENGGCILSEYDCGVRPLPQRFPARNRIIAGLSRAVVVVEAAEKSGALITADFALEEGRDVFAVPGSIFAENSRGTNGLLKKGAAIATEAADMLREYGWQAAEQKKQGPFSLTLEEEALLSLLNYEKGISREELLVTSGLAPSVISLSLLHLVLAGLIEETLPGLYVLTPLHYYNNRL